MNVVNDLFNSVYGTFLIAASVMLIADLIAGLLSKGIRKAV